MSEQGFPVTSRFRILDTPFIQPGKCAVCGAVDRPVVDFNTTIPMYGAVMLCFSCTQEASRGVGMVHRSELDTAEENLAQTLDQQLAFANMIGVPRERYDAIVVAVSGLSDAILFGDPSDSVVVARPSSEIQPPLFDDDATYDLDSEGSDEGDAGSSEQDDNVIVGERSTSISSSDEPRNTLTS